MLLGLGVHVSEHPCAQAALAAAPRRLLNNAELTDRGASAGAVAVNASLGGAFCSQVRWQTQGDPLAGELLRRKNGRLRVFII